MVSGKTAFELPLCCVANSSMNNVYQRYSFVKASRLLTLKKKLTPIELRRQKHTQARFCPPALGLHKLHERSVFSLACICIRPHYYEVGAWSHGYFRGSSFFWIPDIKTMLLKLADYKHNILLRCPVRISL